MDIKLHGFNLISLFLFFQLVLIFWQKYIQLLNVPKNTFDRKFIWNIFKDLESFNKKNCKMKSCSDLGKVVFITVCSRSIRNSHD